MSESTSEDRTLEATPRKLAEARARGEVPVSRDAASAGIAIAALIGVMLTAGWIARRVMLLLLPMLDQPDAFLTMTAQGWQAAAESVITALALAIAPLFGLLLAGALLPYVLQGSVVLAAERIAPKLSHLSPASGARRMISIRGLVEFAKSLVKACGVGFACWVVVRPVFSRAISLTGADLGTTLRVLQHALTSLLLIGAVLALVAAGIDVPYQHIMYRRRMRMSVQDVREEMRAHDGDPRIKARLRRLRRQRARRRMMQRVPQATVVITNPTHVAVALQYRRGRDAAPIVIAKGTDLVALRIREVARAHRVPLAENPPLARALHAAVEIDQVIPHEHFEAVAKIIGLVWAHQGQRAPARQ